MRSGDRGGDRRIDVRHRRRLVRRRRAGAARVFQRERRGGGRVRLTRGRGERQRVEFGRDRSRSARERVDAARSAGEAAEARAVGERPAAARKRDRQRVGRTRVGVADRDPGEGRDRRLRGRRAAVRSGDRGGDRGIGDLQGCGRIDRRRWGGRDFEHRPVVIGAAEFRRSEQVARRVGKQVGNQAAGRKSAVEPVERRQRDGRAVSRNRLDDFERRPVFGAARAGPRRSEQVAGRVDTQTVQRPGAVRAVERGQRDGRAIARSRLDEFEHGAVAGGPAVACHSEQVARRVGNQSGGGMRAVRPVERRQRDGRAVSRSRLDDFEHRSGAVRAARIGCSEQVASRVDHQTGVGPRAESRQSDGRAVSRGPLDEFEHRPDAAGAAGACRSEQVAGRVENQTGGRIGAVRPFERRQRDRRAVSRSRLDEFEYRPVPGGAA